jgi:hypothetical protein
MTREPLTTLSDPRRPMPERAGARLDAARAALASLHEEQRRLERLGFEAPLARCHAQLRYWQFVTGLLSLPRAAGDPCPKDPGR